MLSKVHLLRKLSMGPRALRKDDGTYASGKYRLPPAFTQPDAAEPPHYPFPPAHR